MITGVADRAEPASHHDPLHREEAVRGQRRGDRAASARAFVAEIARQYAQDIPIWEHKRHLERPLLCDGDGPILELRR